MVIILLAADKNKRVIGIMKDELNETIMKEFAGHCLKMFSEKKESDKVEKQKLKGPRNGNQRINQV